MLVLVAGRDAAARSRMIDQCAQRWPEAPIVRRDSDYSSTNTARIREWDSVAAVYHLSNRCGLSQALVATSDDAESSGLHILKQMLQLSGCAPLIELSVETREGVSTTSAQGAAIVELPGLELAVLMLRSPAALVDAIETMWPEHQRYAAMAAGERVSAELRVAHSLVQLARETSAHLLSQQCLVLATGKNHAGARAAATVLCCAAIPSTYLSIPQSLGQDPNNDSSPVTSYTAAKSGPAGPRSQFTELTRGPDADGLPHFEFTVEVPPGHISSVVVRSGVLEISTGGIQTRAPLPPVLRRCGYLHFSPDHSQTARRTITASFVADPSLWPDNLLRP